MPIASRLVLPLTLSLLALAGCDNARETEHSGTEAPEAPQAPVETPVALAPEPSVSSTATPLAEDLTRNEWRTAANKEECAPLVLTTDGGAPATERRANFGGGWGVAFDTETVRSAYGVAGPGGLPVDKADGQEKRLRDQWPYFMRLDNLPKPSFAGYGLEGARPYSDDAPDGVSENSLAYVHVAGQACTYNVWSRLGRAHLEVLLQSLRPGPVE